jgi:hypothetical protein
MVDTSDLVKKVNAACAFGTPNEEITREIVGEIQALIDERDALALKLDKSRAMAEHLAGDDNATLLTPSDFRRWLETLR